MDISGLKDCSLDHVAVAVKDLEVAEAMYTGLGLKFSGDRETVEEQNVIASFAPIGQNAKLELLRPLGGNGPIQKFIDKKGEGIHHLCFKVEDIAKKSQELILLGHTLLYEQAKMGAHNSLVNFIHPKTTGGVLIEISQS